MPIIPEPAQLAPLRAEYEGNPVIDEIEIAVRQRGAKTVRGAAESLQALMLRQPDVYGVLTARERDAVLARFPFHRPDQVCDCPNPRAPRPYHCAAVTTS